MNFVAVMPSLYPKWTERCLNSMCSELWDATLIIDNTVTNTGVAASWNEGIDAMTKADADWLIIVSASMRFGHRGGSDFLETLPRYADAIAVEAGHGVGWHLIAFPRSTIERVGRFDPIYWPAYYEDLDYGRRVKLAFPEIEPPYWVKVTDLDLSMAGFAHGIDLGGADVDGHLLAKKYARKWGGDKGEELFDRPYDDPTLDWTFTGEHA